MKKLFCIILSVLMILSLCACGGNNEDAPQELKIESFSVGYGQADISTNLPLQLYGFAAGGERLSQTILDPIYATCVAFTDPDNTTVLLVATDLCQSFKITADVRQLVSDATGVPVSNILFTASHTHSAPGQDGGGDPNVSAYNEMYKTQCVQAAKDAMADRKPAKMETACGRPEGYVFNRHYVMADGTFLGVGVGSYKQNEIYGHIDAGDNLMQLVKFTREGGKDIVMINWQGHYYGTSEVNYYAISADYPGILRKEVEEALDCESIFILGGSGNQNTKSQIDTENKHKNYIEFGEALAQEALKVAEGFQPAETGKIALVENMHTFAGSAAAIPLYAFGFGDFGCATAPNELFSSTGIGVREASKFKYTFIATCANGNYKYLPDEFAFTYKSYEAEECTLYPKGTAEAMQEELTKLLDTVFTATGGSVKEKDPGYITDNSPKSDGVEYTNPFPGDLTACREMPNGLYQITVLTPQQTLKDFFVKDKETAEKVLTQTNLKLLFDGRNIIAGLGE